MKQQRKNGTKMVTSKIIKRTEDEIIYEYLPEGNLRPGYIYIDLILNKVQVEPSPDDETHHYLDHVYFGINTYYIENHEFPEMVNRCWG